MTQLFLSSYRIDTSSYFSCLQGLSLCVLYLLSDTEEPPSFLGPSGGGGHFTVGTGNPPF